MECIRGHGRDVKVGDLVKIARYGSQLAPDGSVGLIVEEIQLDPRSLHKAYRVQCIEGYVARHADFCLEVVSEGR